MKQFTVGDYTYRAPCSHVVRATGSSHIRKHGQEGVVYAVSVLFCIMSHHH